MRYVAITCLIDIMEEMMMTPEQKMMYELLGGREAYMRNRMQLYDADGNLLNANGVAGMCMNGVSLSEAHQIIDVPEKWRDVMFEETKRHFIQENGVADGDTTKRSEVFTAYQKSTPIEDRLKGTWTLEQYERQYTKAFYDAVKAADPSWELGQPFDRRVLDSVTRENVDNTLVVGNGAYGQEFVRKGVSYVV